MPASATKILIIDDDADLVSLLTDNLQLEGFSPSPAYNGEDGLLKLSQENFDLVILDVMMPGMKGTEVLAKIREHSHIPVIMLTARGDPADRIIGLELGADDYVPKPFTPRELVANPRYSAPHREPGVPCHAARCRSSHRQPGTAPRVGHRDEKEYRADIDRVLAF